MPYSIWLTIETVVSGGIKNAPSMACKVVESMTNSDIAINVADEPIFPARLIDKERERVR